MLTKLAQWMYNTIIGKVDMNITRSYKYRVYPNKKQKELIAKTFGCCRFVYNYYLDKRIKEWKNNKKTLGFFACCKDLTILKQEKEWLREPDKCSLQNELKHLDAVYKKFFKEHKGFPKFKSKKTHRFSYTTNVTNNNIEFVNKKIKLPKLGWVRTRDKQIPQGRILNATISQEPSGRYYVSVCCTDVDIKPYEKTNRKIGIDLGIADFAITNNGTKYANPRYLAKSLDKLARLQQSLSRKTRGGKNWEKARIKVAKCYEHITNQKKDYLNKLSTKIVKGNDVICIEDLNIQDMIQDGNTTRRRNISDVSWYEFTQMLQYKSDWYGKKLVKIDQYYPSTQTCCYCGFKNVEAKDTSVRKWICPKCGQVHDRDINAAINILREGLKIA